MSQKSPPSTRNLRADAQKNYTRLIDAAHKLFMKKGPDASLEEIARKAEVGIGTLYRHFPTRNDLIESVYSEQIDALIARARELHETLPPGEALVTFMYAAADHMLTYSALKACLVAARTDGKATHRQWSTRYYEAVELLLSSAVKAGAVRGGLDASGLMRLVHSITVAAEKSADPAGQVKLFLSVMIDGLTKTA